MILHETDMPRGTLYVYTGKVTIDEHLSRQKEPAFVLPNMIVTTGRQYLINTGPLTDINIVKLGDDGTARSLGLIDLVSPQFTAGPTDIRISGTQIIIELFVGVEEANFIHREIGLFAGEVLISTLKVVPEFEKTTAKTRTYLYTLGWD